MYQNYVTESYPEKTYMLMMIARSQKHVRLKLGFVDVHLGTAKDVSVDLSMTLFHYQLFQAFTLAGTYVAALKSLS